LIGYRVRDLRLANDAALADCAIGCWLDDSGFCVVASR
jgi:hypothetical protein